MYANIPIKHMAYLSVHFIKDTKLLDNYIVSDKIKTSIETPVLFNMAIKSFLRPSEFNDKKVNVCIQKRNCTAPPF